MRPQPEPIAPGQESVWRYPRPAIAEPSDRHVRIVHRGVIVAETRRAVRTLETSHPPSWYLPLADVTSGLLRPSPRRSFCEWNGDAGAVKATAHGRFKASFFAVGLLL